MSRSGYSDDYGEDNSGYLYRGAVASAFRGRRGQAFLKEMLAALDALPEKKLIAGELIEPDTGEVCAIGAVGKARGIDMLGIDPEDAEKVSGTFGIAEAMARELVFENDDEWRSNTETPEARFARMRQWIASQIHA